MPAHGERHAADYEACQWVVDKLNGPEPAALWGLSDGDVAWWCYDALARMPGVDRRWLDGLALTSGLHPEDRDELWPLFDEACRIVPHWLVQCHASGRLGRRDAGVWLVWCWMKPRRC
jgi:hypothetical protein